MSDPEEMAPNVAATSGWIATAIIEPQLKARSEEFGGNREAGTGMLALWHCAAVAHKLTGASIPIDAGWTTQ